MKLIPGLTKFLLLAVVLSLAAASGCGGGKSKSNPIVPIPTNTGTGGSTDEMLTLINNARTTDLTLDGSISAVAQAYANWHEPQMAMSYSPTADGLSPSIRLTNGGVTYTSCDETGALGLTALMESAAAAYPLLDSTKLNNPAFTRCGIGVKTYY
ncbi:MAG: hypothetical protein ACYS8W_17275 [Planctomycetota bacterium]